MLCNPPLVDNWLQTLPARIGKFGIMIETDYTKIKVYKDFDPNEMLTPNLSGKGATFNPHFSELMTDYYKQFNDVLLEPIIDKIGNDGWRLEFKEVDVNIPSFICTVFTPNDTYYNSIVDLVQKKVKDITITGFNRENRI